MVHSGSFIRLLPGDGTTEIAARLLPLLETIFDVSASRSTTESAGWDFSMEIVPGFSPMAYRLTVGEGKICLNAGSAEALWEGVLHFLTVFGHRTDGTVGQLYPYEKDYDPIRDSIDR